MNPATQISNLFNNKGYMAGITDKALRNFCLKSNTKVDDNNIIPVTNSTVNSYKTQYFAFSHAFKNIDKAIFEITCDEKGEAKSITFPKLYAVEWNEELCLKVGELLNNIRNFNSHYYYKLDIFKVNKIDTEVIDILKQAFKFSSLIAYLNEGEQPITYNEYLNNPYHGKDFVNFLVDKFYPAKKAEKEEPETEKIKIYNEKRGKLKCLTIDEIIDHLLFITVTSRISWQIERQYNCFDIEPGKYLSFYACLFLTSVFLYRNESNQLISKIKGFKRNDDNKYRSKLNIFLLFSKKFTSQDVDNEQKHLVQFHNIINYLNHYPTAWNKELQLKSECPQLSDPIKEYLIKTEITKQINKLHQATIDEIKAIANRTNIEFVDYIYHIIKGMTAKKQTQNHYNTILNTPVEILKVEAKIKKTKSILEKLLYEKDIDKLNRDLRKYENELRELNKESPPSFIETIKKRVNNGMFYVSYGRNVDRFMEFATRFFAETNYFGSEAEFKCYQIYDPQKQKEFLEDITDKKEKDKLKFNQGRLIHFITYEKHLKQNSDWDTPFVIQNDTIQIKLKFNQTVKIVNLQRGLVIYLLEHALYVCKPEESLADKGKVMLTEYYPKHQKDFGDYIQQLQKPLTAQQATNFRKLMPKKLVNNYLNNEDIKASPVNYFTKLLDKTERDDKHYKEMLDKAVKVKCKDEFLKRNKGKQYKLHFIRKACHVMYFKNSYLQQKQQLVLQNLLESAKDDPGHHKSLHINREQFNDFCKWMYAFDETPVYKALLNDLFKQTGFNQYTEFKQLFSNSQSLNDMYVKTKENYKQWLTQQTQNLKKIKYQLEDYKNILNKKDDEKPSMWFINLSHFLSFAKSERYIFSNKSSLVLNSVKNSNKYLISEFYTQPEVTNNKEQKKLQKKLFTARHEDALLYGLAWHCRNLEKDIASQSYQAVDKLLQSDIEFSVKDREDNNKQIYTLTVPFNKVDEFAELMTLKKQQEENINNKKRIGTFLTNIPGYLQLVKTEGKTTQELEDSINNFTNKKTLTYENLFNIQKHLITTGNALNRLTMELDKYFHCKPDQAGKVDLPSKFNTDEYIDIPAQFKTYFGEGASSIRNRAMHSGIPQGRTFTKTLRDCETRFLNEEINKQATKTPADLSALQKSVCLIMCQLLHNNYYNSYRTIKINKPPCDEYVLTQFINQVINKRP